MKIILVIILFSLVPSSIFAQGIFTEKGNTSFDAGTGYVIYDDFNSQSFHLSTSVQGIVDIKFNYVNRVPNNMINSTLNLAVFVKKDSLYGVALNGSAVAFNNALEYLVGFSIYGKLKFINGFLHNFAPIINIGYLTSNDVLVGTGLAFERKINKNYSIVLTQTVNIINRSQIIMGVEFIYQY